MGRDRISEWVSHRIGRDCGGVGGLQRVAGVGYDLPVGLPEANTASGWVQSVVPQRISDRQRQHLSLIDL